MHGNVFSEISLIIALAAGVSLIMRWLRQPLIIGHILTGILVGPAFLDILHADASFAGLSEIGVALLLFIIGLDLSVKALKRVGKAVFVTTLMQIGIVSTVGYAMCLLLGFTKTESAILGLGLALSSTIIIVKLLNDKKETGRLYAQIAIGVLLLQDVVATFAKIGLAARSEQGDTTHTILLLGLRGIGLIAAMYLVVKYIIPLLTHVLEHSKELMLLFSLGWGLGIALLFQKAGFSIEIGALFAGVSLASLPYSNEMASRLKPLRDFFLVIFFITLGQAMSPDQLGGVIAPALALSLVVLIVKPVSVMTSMGLLGYTKRASFKAGVAMSQVSEFSLVFLVAAQASGFVSQTAAATLTLTALITFATSAYLINYDNSLYLKLESHLRLFEQRVTKHSTARGSATYPIVLFGYRKGGHEFLKAFENMGKRYIVVDYDPENIETLEHQRIKYLYGDATDAELLDELNLRKTKLVVSTIGDTEANKFLAHWLGTHNPEAVFVCATDRAEHATELYAEGASYVMLPHFIGSEKISSFIRKNGFNKAEFRRFREKHLAYLETHLASLETTTEIT